MARGFRFEHATFPNEAGFSGILPVNDATGFLSGFGYVLRGGPMIRSFGAGLVFLMSFVAGSVSAEGIFVAGVNPSERPADAPVVTAVTKGADWYAHALHGVDQPYPASLRFLEDQGNWFTPFTAPGMLAPYDLRGWH